MFKSAEEDVQRIPVGPISIRPTYHESQLNKTQNINFPTPERTDMFQSIRNGVSNNSLDQEQDTNQNPTQLMKSQIVIVKKTILMLKATLRPAQVQILFVSSFNYWC